MLQKRNKIELSMPFLVFVFPFNRVSFFGFGFKIGFHFTAHTYPKFTEVPLPPGDHLQKSWHSRDNNRKPMHDSRKRMAGIREERAVVKVNLERREENAFKSEEIGILNNLFISSLLP